MDNEVSAPELLTTVAKPPRMDARVVRTHAHIIKIAREMLSDGDVVLSVTSIGKRAEVSRRTLYMHWNSVADLVAETIDIKYATIETFDGLDLEQRLDLFLTHLAEELLTAIGAIGTLIGMAQLQAEAREALADIQHKISRAFSERITELDSDDYAQLVMPIIMYSAINGDAVDRALLDGLVARGAQLLKDEAGTLSPVRAQS
jgi:AcrR family transcriptional regulator